MMRVEAYRCVAVAALASASVLCTSQRAAAAMVEFQADILTEQGMENPLVLFGFNPQPEPPDPSSLVNMRDPAAPRVAWSNEGHQYEIIFAFDPGMRVTFDTADAMPDANGLVKVGMEKCCIPEHGGFDVYFDVQAPDGTFDPGSWVGFNPQPEPPAGYPPGNAIGFEFEVTPASPTSVDIGLMIEDRATGNRATFRLIPEPASAGLLALGALGALCPRRCCRGRP